MRLEFPKGRAPSALPLDPGCSRAQKFTRANDFMDLRPPLRNFDRPRLSAQHSFATQEIAVDFAAIAFWAATGGKPAESKGIHFASRNERFRDAFVSP